MFQKSFLFYFLIMGKNIKNYISYDKFQLSWIHFCNLATVRLGYDF